MRGRMARVARAIRAYYDWDNEPTNPVMPLVELGPDIDEDQMWVPPSCGHEAGKKLPSIEEWRTKFDQHVNATGQGVPAPGVDDCSSRERGWMGTFLGGKFFPLQPRSDEVTIEDIAHGLAMTCRYGGQCNRFYSVAEHCVHVSHMVDPKYALHGLLHDSAEAYIGDMIRPLKHQPEMIAFRNAEEAIELEVAIRFGLHWSDEAKRNVKDIYNRILADEVLQLQTNPQHYEDVLEQKPLGITLPCWNPSEAEQKFIWRYLELTLAARTRTHQP